MKGAITVAGATAAGSTGDARHAGRPSAGPGRGSRGPRRRPERPGLRAARRPGTRVMAGTVHDIDLPIIEKDITVAEGFVVHAWTFGGTVPGPDASASTSATRSTST